MLITAINKTNTSLTYMKSQNKEALKNIARKTALFAVPLFVLASVSVGSRTASAVGTKPSTTEQTQNK
jgi:surface polysaccharide O-acyltransferase-like enzyme